MNAQPDLFDFASRAVRNTDPDTSREAAAARLGGKTSDRRMVLFEIWAVGDKGLTDFELATLIGRQQTSCGKRRGELRDLGLVEDSGHRRPAPSGSNAIVWRITEQGRAIMRGSDDVGRASRRSVQASQGNQADFARRPT